MQCLRIAVLVTMVCAAGCAKSDRRASPRYNSDRGILPGNQWPMASPSAMRDAKEVEPPKILPETHLAAGKLFESQGMFGKAIHQYRKAVAVNHHFPEAHNRLGLLLSMAGSRAEALTAFRKAVELSPKDATLRNNLGFELLLAKQWAAAEYEFDQALRIRPDFPRAYINLGIAQSKLGKFHDALASFRTVLPEADAYYNVGLMYRTQRRYRDAADTFRRVLALDGDFTAARTQLAELARKGGATGVNDPVSATAGTSIAAGRLSAATYRNTRPRAAHAKARAAGASSHTNRFRFAHGSKVSRTSSGRASARNDTAAGRSASARIDHSRVPSQASVRTTRRGDQLVKPARVSEWLSAPTTIAGIVISILENEFNCIEERFLADADTNGRIRGEGVNAFQSCPADASTIAVATAMPYPGTVRPDACEANEGKHRWAWTDSNVTWSTSDIQWAETCRADDVTRDRWEVADAGYSGSWALLRALEARLREGRDETVGRGTVPDDGTIRLAQGRTPDNDGDGVSPGSSDGGDERLSGPPVIIDRPNQRYDRAAPPTGQRSKILRSESGHRGQKNQQGASTRVRSDIRDGPAQAPKDPGIGRESSDHPERKSPPADRTIGSLWRFDQSGGQFGLTMEAFARWQLACSARWNKDLSGLVRRAPPWSVTAFDIDATLFPDPICGINATADRSMYDMGPFAGLSRVGDAHADLSGAFDFTRKLDSDGR